MRLIYCILFTIISYGTFSQTNGSNTLISGGISRSFVFHLPATTPNCNLPLLIVYHGDGGTGTDIQGYSGFDALANTQNFIVVYPNSTTIWGTQQWNKYADNQPGFAPSGETNAADDVQFTSDLIEYFANNYAINRNRVYATGHSGGGFMCFYLSIALNNKIAAIAPVAGSVWGEDNYLNAYFDNNQNNTDLSIDGQQSIYIDFSDGLIQAYSSNPTNKQFIEAISQKFVNDQNSISWFGLGKKKFNGIGNLSFRDSKDLFNFVTNETNYKDIMAPIKESLERITTGKNDAILITDFEEYSPDGKEEL
jgi:predicted esterase